MLSGRGIMVFLRTILYGFLLFLGAVEAAELGDDAPTRGILTHLDPKSSDVFDGRWWREDQVGVVYCPAKGAVCSVTYDVFGEMILKPYTTYAPDFIDVITVQPIFVALKNEFLMGFSLDKDVPEPFVRDAHFCLQDVDLSKCVARDFASRLLDACVEPGKLNEALQNIEKIHFPAGNDNNANMMNLYGFFPGIGHTSWSVVESSDVVQALQKEERPCDYVFVLVRNEGIFQGRFVKGFSCFATAAYGSLMALKVRKAGFFMQRQFKASDWAKARCLNCPNGVMLWG